jgi:signal transduction histidine kinase
MNDNTAGQRQAGTLVLNVNDHDGVRYMISRMLDRAGFRVVEAGTGADALAKVHSLLPRLVVLDIKLPDSNGLDVCRQIKSDSETSWIKVLHTSAIFVAPEAKVQSLNSGADGYLSYPFEQEELIATARSLIRLLDAEQSLRNTAAELQEANRRTHEFLAMLAHELRNPLSAIATCLPVLERFEARDEPELSARDVMRRQIRHLRRLVDDLLDAARVTQGKIEPRWETVDLVALLRRVVGTSRRMLTDERQQMLEVMLPDEAIHVRADPLRLEQVFWNLLDNASKYTDPGGHIRIELVTSDGRAHVFVRDDGIGIPPDALPTIFNLFCQANVNLERSRGGLGIGLTLVKTLIEMHGGAVRAHSDGAGQGCTMEIELPVLAAQSVASETAASAGDLTTTRRKVLIVEDNADARQVLKSLLELWGHEVTVAADGGAGIEAIDKYRPDIALVDIGLPITDGYEVARRLRTHGEREKLLLVALTGYGAAEQRARALDAGFDLHLVKPVEPEQLASIISHRQVHDARSA